MPRAAFGSALEDGQGDYLDGLHEVVLERPDRRGGPGSHARLVEDVLDVVARRLGRDAEGLGDLLVGLSGGERKQDLELAVRQARGQLAWPLRHAVSGRGEHGVDCLRAQPALARVAQQLGLGAVSVDAAVARSVAVMVVQSEAAATLLDHDPQRSDAMMEAIEHTGRQALKELRLILGVLRSSNESRKREPQPSVDQIYTLIRRARELGQPVELNVGGEPGTLPPGVELALYRIVEDALATAAQQPDSSVDVAVRSALRTSNCA